MEAYTLYLSTGKEKFYFINFVSLLVLSRKFKSTGAVAQG